MLPVHSLLGHRILIACELALRVFSERTVFGIEKPVKGGDVLRDFKGLLAKLNA